MSILRRIGLLALCLALGGCVSVRYDPNTPSYFTGSLLVIWIDEGSSGGDGTFLFVPNPRDMLTFHRNVPEGHGRTIQPGLMYTDGGSIPRIAQLFNGLSPWGYAPAYMIHDWLFTARHCLVDGDDSLKYDQIRGIDFDESARILNDAISALVNQRQVKRDDIALAAITAAVDSAIARALWDKQGACGALKVKPEHIAAARRVIPDISSFSTNRSPVATALDREFRAAIEATRGKQLPAARIVNEVSFKR